MKRISDLSLLLLATLGHVFVSGQQYDWPSIKTATVFKTQMSLFTAPDDLSVLTPVQNTVAQTLADSSRNKAMLHTLLTVPYFG